MTFDEYIKRLLEAYDINKTKMAKWTGYSRIAIGNWTNGKNVANNSTMLSVLRALSQKSILDYANEKDFLDKEMKLYEKAKKESLRKKR